jgi:cytochrome b561
MPGWQRMLARTVHVGFYALMLAMPLSGWALVSVSPTGISTVLYGVAPWPHLPVLGGLAPEAKRAALAPAEFVHSTLAWLALGLLALHVAGALRHQFIDRDGLIARMAPGLFGPTAGPPRRARGLVPALAAALGAFALVAGPGLLGGGRDSLAQETPLAASSAPAWAVDPAASRIAFTGAYMGRPFSGVFERWTADIRFDPDAPAEARIRVVVDAGSATTGEPYFDESVREGDWFNVIDFPDVAFAVNEGVERLGPTSWEATGVLTVKGQAYPLRLPFELAIDGDVARMTATVGLQRTALGIGLETLTEARGDEEWVADEVRVDIEVAATRQPE